MHVACTAMRTTDSPEVRRVCQWGVGSVQPGLTEARGYGRVLDAAILVYGRLRGGEWVEDTRERGLEDVMEDDGLVHVHVGDLGNHG